MCIKSKCLKQIKSWRGLNCLKAVLYVYSQTLHDIDKYSVLCHVIRINCPICLHYHDYISQPIVPPNTTETLK